MFFTQDDYKKIQQWLTKNSVKDTEFNEANIPFNGNEIVSIVQGNQNKKVFLKDLVAQIFNLGVSDFVNITDKYNAPNINLEEAIRLIPSRARKEGQVITFLDMEDHWHIYQFKGVLNQWNILDTWEDLFDWEKLIIDSILPDEEDLTKSLPDANGNSYLSLKDRVYNPEDFSGLGRVILRKNIVEVEDPIYGKVKKNVLYQDMFTQTNTINEIRYDFDLNGQEIAIPKDSTLLYNGGSLNNGVIIYDNTIIEGKERINNIVTRGEYIDKGDSIYDPTNFSGLGRKYLKKNIISGKNILTQELINKPNTIYIIQYDYDLNGAEITIPENCVLDFQGGSLNNGEIAGSNISLHGYSKFTDVYMNISGDISCHNIFFNYIHHLSKACFIINNAKKVVVDKVRIETLENLYPYLNAPAGCGGINIYNSSNIHIHNCYIKNTEERNTSEENAYIHAPIMLKSSHNILIENCHIENSPTEYIALWDSCSNAKVINCICENTRGGETTYGNSAIATTGPDGDIFIDNVIAKNVGASGFSLNCKDVTIINSTVENNKDAHGITLGHNMENGRVERAFVSNCIIKIDNPTADQFGIYNEGTNNSELIILNCKIQNYRRAIGTSANNTRIENVTYNYPIEKFNVLGGSFFCEHLLRSSNNTSIKINNCTGETCYSIINFKELPKDYSYNVAITNSSFITYIGLQIYNTNKLSSNKENIFICKGNTINSIDNNSTFVIYDTSKLKYIIENNVINTSKYLIEQVSPPNDITGFDSVYNINSNIINTTFKDKTLFYFEYPERENKPCLLFNNNYVNVGSSGNNFQNMTTIINNNNVNLT